VLRRIETVLLYVFVHREVRLAVAVEVAHSDRVRVRAHSGTCGGVSWRYFAPGAVLFEQDRDGVCCNVFVTARSGLLVAVEVDHCHAERVRPGPGWAASVKLAILAPGAVVVEQDRDSFVVEVRHRQVGACRRR